MSSKKRKAFKPKKLDVHPDEEIAANENEKGSIQTLQGKLRGRKRKATQQHTTTVNDASGQTTVQSPRKTSSSGPHAQKKATKTYPTRKVAAATKPVRRKRRGRKKKIVQQAPKKEKEVEKPPRKRPGRKKKVVKEPVETKSVQNAAVVEEPLKKRRRTSQDSVESEQNEADIEEWTKPELSCLLERIKEQIPYDDTMKFDSRVKRLDWEKVKFGSHTGKECQKKWLEIQSRVRGYRVLREMISDAEKWMSKPWTNFYKKKKQRHPHKPKKPLTAFMIFYLEHTDDIAKKNPTLDRTKVSKIVSGMYRRLSKKKKQEYINRASEGKKKYRLELEEFYIKFPEEAPKRRPAHYGPNKPLNPFMIFFTEKLSQPEKEDSNQQRQQMYFQCRKEWAQLSDHKKLVWINKALEDETRYKNELDVYVVDHPDFVPWQMRPLLSKEETQILERYLGKPAKPPNSGYSLYSKVMLGDNDLQAKVGNQNRMQEISRKWKDLPNHEKLKYDNRAEELRKNYKLDFALYLESLPEAQRERELKPHKNDKSHSPFYYFTHDALAALRRERHDLTQLSDATQVLVERFKNLTKEEKRFYEAKARDKVVIEAREKENQIPPLPNIKELYKDEPEPPPRNAYYLFLKKFVCNAHHISPQARIREAPNYWALLPPGDRIKYEKRHQQMKEQYTVEYEQFKQRLDPEEVLEFELIKERRRREGLLSSTEDVNQSLDGEESEEELSSDYDDFTTDEEDIEDSSSESFSDTYDTE